MIALYTHTASQHNHPLATHSCNEQLTTHSNATHIDNEQINDSKVTHKKQRRSSDVKGVENKDMLVVLGKGDNVSFRGDLEATASTHLDIRTLKLTDQRAIPLKHCHMEAVAMTVSNENITRITDINAIRIVGDAFTSDAVQKVTLLIEHHHTMTL